MAQLPTTPIEDRIVEIYGGGPYITNVATADLNAYVTEGSTPQQERTVALDELHRRAWADFTDTTSADYRDSQRSTDAVTEILIDAHVADYELGGENLGSADHIRISQHRSRRAALTDGELLRVRAARWISAHEKELAENEIARRVLAATARIAKLAGGAR